MTEPALRTLGKSEVRVSVLGFGASGNVGDPSMSESDAGMLLNSVLDLGIRLVDTARSYGLAEERIGRHLAHRRREFVLSTKVGYGIEGFDDWTGPCVVAGIDRALRVMQTDVIDIVHLHSCPVDVARRDDIFGALEAAHAAGKIRVAAYSGDNEAAKWAARSGRFGSVQTSISVVDQRSIDEVLPATCENGVGVIAKRALANAVWRHAERPPDWAEAQYWERWRILGFQFGNQNDVALRFAAFTSGVASAIVGSRSLEHLRANVASIERGPLPADAYALIRVWWERNGSEWRGVV